MADLEKVLALVPQDAGLTVVVTQRADGSPQTSVVNAGVLDHPVSGEPVVGLVTAGEALKLRLLRRQPRATLVLRAGWDWVAVEGPADVAGPDDKLTGFDWNADGPTLLRAVFTAAGGTHDDWDEYDRVMKEERRTAVLVHPERVTNG